MICVISILLYVLLAIPFLLSVKCGNFNEGFYFGYGQHLLEGDHLYKDIFASRGPLFIIVYALVLKLFGFGAGSIIAIHFIHLITIVLIGVSLYLIANKIFTDKCYAGLAVLFWSLLQLTPIGNWGFEYEWESVFSLEAEYFCVLFSLLSIYCLFNSFSMLSGILAACSIMFKASGAVVSIAILYFFVYLFLFQKNIYKKQERQVVLFTAGLVTSLLVFLIALYIHNGELTSFFNTFCSLGYYSDKPTQSIFSFFISLKDFMFRYTNSYSNFILFSLAIGIFINTCITAHPLNLLCGWRRKGGVHERGATAPQLMEGHLKVTGPTELSLHGEQLFLLICIWSIGNIFAALAPGKYSSYYYILVYPSVSLALSYGLSLLSKKKTIIQLAIVTMIIIFGQRIFITFPHYLKIAQSNLVLSFLNQPESFQDPVQPSNNSNRLSYLKIADKINSYLPNKKDSLYIFNFVGVHRDFSPTMYIYAKRMPFSTVYADYLFVDKSLEMAKDKLWEDFSKKPPMILIMPKDFYIQEWQVNRLSGFFNDLNLLIGEKYKLIDSFQYKSDGLDKIETHLVYELIS